MKNILIVLLVMCSVNSLAKGMLNIFLRDKSKVSYAFDDKPKVEFKDRSLFIITIDKVIEFQKSDILKFTFTDTDANTRIDKIQTSNLKSEYIEIYTVAGKLVKRMQAKNGKHDIDTDELANGLYVIKCGNTTYKISKK